MTTLTPEQMLKEAQNHKNRIVSRADDRIKTYMENAQKDFCNFFHWQAGEMYRAQMLRDYFSEMPDFADYEDIESIKKALGNRIERIESELINTPSFGTCTDEVVNLEHRLKLDGKRAIRSYLLEFTSIFQS